MASVFVVLLSACGGGGVAVAPQSTPVRTSSAAPTATPVATPTPAPVGSAAFNDWPTYGYDAARDGFNPNTTRISPASIANGGLHLAWQVAGGTAQTQPIVATNVAGHQALVIVADGSSIDAYDGLTGSAVWTQPNLQTQNLQACGTLDVAGTPYYDAALGALFVAAGNGSSPNHVILYELSVTSGSILSQLDVTPTLLAGETTSAHTSVTAANGLLYLGTGSNCETASWRGRVVSVNPSSMTLQNTFFTTYGVGGNPYGGGGVWGWGGVSADSSGNIYVATGNAETSSSASAPFVAAPNEQAGYGEHLVKLSGDLSTVEGSNYPGFNFANSGDLDYTGTPVVFAPSGCDLMSGTQDKSGTLVINDTTNLSTPTSYQLSEPSGKAAYTDNPGYSPGTGLLYAAVASSQDGSLEPPGMVALAFSSCSSSILWHAQFGPDSFSYTSYGGGSWPRSAPTVTAGGVAFMGTPCTSNGSGGCGTPGAPSGALWAVDASTGTVLGGGNPVLMTPDNIRMAPSADGYWLWVMDDSGNLYGLTVDPSVHAIAQRPGTRSLPTFRMPR